MQSTEEVKIDTPTQTNTKTQPGPSKDEQPAFRKLATIRTVDNLLPIEGADLIEVAVIGGWKVVVKKGEHKVGDLVVYCEIDSWIPNAIAPFLTKGDKPSEYNGVKGERLRTIKLKGQVSQGLVLPMSVLAEFKQEFKVGDDVSKLLGIQKWEPPVPAGLASTVKGPFPGFLRKTDQERIQNLEKELSNWKTKEYTWEVTEKLDGTSMTVYYNNGVFGVCSRNLDLVETEDNNYWKTARALKLEEKLKEIGRNLALQGELIGEGIQGNKYKLTGIDMYLFDIYDIDKGVYLNAKEREELTKKLGIKHCPVIKFYTLSKDETSASLLTMAEGKSALNKNTEREGLVFKCIEENISFKAISNKFLLKNNE